MNDAVLFRLAAKAFAYGLKCFGCKAHEEDERWGSLVGKLKGVAAPVDCYLCGWSFFARPGEHRASGDADQLSNGGPRHIASADRGGFYRPAGRHVHHIRCPGRGLHVKGYVLQLPGASLAGPRIQRQIRQTSLCRSTLT